METDSYFYRLFKQLPETYFELIGLPSKLARRYRFDSVELKKSLRVDGVLIPATRNLPVHFAEVQYKRLKTFYANLFTKVFAYLEENDPEQEWFALALFPTRSMEPTGLAPYEDLLQSQRVKRIYLDEFPMPPDPPLGLSILQMVIASTEETKPLASRLIHQAEVEIPDSELSSKVIELVGRWIVTRFPEMKDDEVEAMFQLTDIRKTQFWKDVHAKGRQEGRAETQLDIARKLASQGKTVTEIAELLELTAAQVRKLMKQGRR